jgi:hypothetical protein
MKLGYLVYEAGLITQLPVQSPGREGKGREGKGREGKGKFNYK